MKMVLPPQIGIKQSKSSRAVGTQLPAIGTQLKAADGTPLLNRVISLSDPNRNPNWDWTDCGHNVDLYTIALGHKSVSLPYCKSSSPIFGFFEVHPTGQVDIHPKDGWRLVLRDFGTPQRNVSVPFFILYNRNTGLLRYIYFATTTNYRVSSVTGTLSFTGSIHAPLFTLADSSGQFVNNYDIYQTNTLAKYYPYSWNVIDFRIAGYDPDIDTKNAKFTLNVSGSTKFNLKATGQVGIHGILGVGGSTHSNIFKTVFDKSVTLYKDIAKGYKTINDAQETFEDLLDFSGKHKDAWWSNIISSVASVGATSWIPALGPIVGIANFIMGGGSSMAPQPRPITLTGKLKIKGKLLGPSSITQLEFIVPGANVTNPNRAARQNKLPLYNKKIGIFNLAHTPVVSAEAWGGVS